MIIEETEIRENNIIEVAKKMLTAARTSPKARGVDIMTIKMVTGDDIKELSDYLYKVGESENMAYKMRDAKNILKAGAVLLLGTKIVPMGLNCAYCGFATCMEKPKSVPCALNATDVGIAIGSAVSLAADMRVDSRVMFSVGKAAKDMGIMDETTNVYAIPISASSKSPFFDR